jgi:hypothetical protein
VIGVGEAREIRVEGVFLVGTCRAVVKLESEAFVYILLFSSRKKK